MLKKISSWLNQEVWDRLRTKFPTFGDLLYWEHQIRKESGSTARASDLGVKDVDPKEKRPWKKLPNIRDFTIEVLPYDWVFMLFGLTRRYSPKMQFVPWKNAPVNKYVEYMFKRLEKQVQSKRFNEAVETLWILMNSKAYLSVAINAVLENWHRKIPMWQMNAYIHEVNNLIKRRATNIEYRRVYLEEPNKIRPLGVPSVPWRIYLHMYNNLLTQWRLVTESKSQHAYLPGRGTMTAWNELVKLLDSPNIYEADYTGFFDNISHNGLRYVLTTRLGIPSNELEFIMRLNSSVVKLPAEKLLFEPDVGKTHIDRLWDYNYEELVGNAKYKDRGVPQGAPTSPNLATLVHRVLERVIKVIFYADDLIVFPKNSDSNPLNKIENRLLGLKAKASKSKWLKKDGIWLVESFKFIGIRYYPPKPLMTKDDVITLWVLSILIDLLFLPIPMFCFLTTWITWRDWGLKSQEIFEADTRKGAKLRFTNRESLISYLLIARDGINSKYTGKTYKIRYTLRDWLRFNTFKWMKIRGKSKLLWNNRYTGWFMARMYMNDWEVEQYADFNLKYRHDSWMNIVWPEYRIKWKLQGIKVSIFTASSFATHDLLRIIHDSRLKTKPRKFIKYIQLK